LDLAGASLKIRFQPFMAWRPLHVQCFRKLNLGATLPRFGNSRNVEMFERKQRRDVNRLSEIVTGSGLWIIICDCFLPQIAEPLPAGARLESLAPQILTLRLTPRPWPGVSAQDSAPRA
jgi:hypothetical protein